MGWSCATEHCEPCQAGNRAALSGFFRAPQSIGSFVRPIIQAFILTRAFKPEPDFGTRFLLWILSKYSQIQKYFKF